MRELFRDRAVTLTVLLHALVVLVLYNAPVPAPGVRFRDAIASWSQAKQSWLRLPPIVLSYYSDWSSSDIRRYYSFANLMVGKPADVDDLMEGWGELGKLSMVMVPPREVNRPQVPYRDFAIEYPPAVIPPILLPRLFSSTLAGYTALFQLQMGVLYIAAGLLALRYCGSGRRSAALLGLLSTLAIGPILLQRLDLLVSFLLVTAVTAGIRRLPLISGVSLALGTGIKLFPLLLAPILLLFFRAGERLRFLLALSITLALVFVPALLVGGDRLGVVFAYHAARPIQLESLYAGVLNLYNWWRPGSVAFEVSYGSGNLVTPLQPYLKLLGTVVPLGLVLLVTALFARVEKTPATFSRACLAAVLAVLSTSRMLSAQYVVWLFPLALLLTGAYARRIVFLLIAACALTQVIFPGLYGRLEDLEPAMGLLLCARNGLLLYSLYLLLRPWWRASLREDGASATL